MAEQWYRYEDYRSEIRPYIRLRTFPVVKTTPKGVWLSLGFAGRKFVLADARKRFACPTEEEAMQSFIARKRTQKRILEGQLKHVSQALAMGEAGEIDTSTVLWSSF